MATLAASPADRSPTPVETLQVLVVTPRLETQRVATVALLVMVVMPTVVPSVVPTEVQS